MGLIQFGNSSPKLYAFTYANKVILGEYADNFAKRPEKIVKVGGVSGGYNVYQNTRTPQDIGKVTQELFLFARTRADMDDYRDALRGIVDWGTLPLYKKTSNPSDAWRYINALCTEVDMKINEASQDGLRQRAKVTFMTEQPGWMLQGSGAPIIGFNFNIGTTIIGGTGGAVVIAHSGSVTNTPVPNAGNLEAFPVFVIETGVSGQLTPPFKIQNIVNGAVEDEVTYNVALAASETMTIDVSKQTVVHNGIDAYTLDFDFRLPGWFRINPGNNTIRVVSGSGADSASVTVYFTERYY